MCLLLSLSFFFFFNDTATTEIYTLSLHDALPILDLVIPARDQLLPDRRSLGLVDAPQVQLFTIGDMKENVRSEEHTSELQSRLHLVCRLLLEKKKKIE